MDGSEKYLKVFFGKQTGYYWDNYVDYVNGRKFTFNIGSFFFGFFWMLYRKLYWQALGYISVLIGVDIMWNSIYSSFLVGIEIQKGIMIIDAFLFAFILGFIGNWLYFKSVDRRVSAILQTTAEEEKRIELLTKKGGVSYIAFIIFGIWIAAIVLLVYYSKQWVN